MYVEFTWGQVPVLEVDGKQLAQASALNRYLARRFNLVGENEYESAKCDEFVDAIKDYISGEGISPFNLLEIVVFVN